jgi:hypothetical protein
MNNQDIKQRILTSIEKAREEGYTLIQGDWGDERMKCACAIGCVYVAANQHIDSNYEDAADLLGVDEGWISSFTNGFDMIGEAAAARDPQAWNLGDELRILTKPIDYEAFVDKMYEDDDGEADE